jgi:hypothetical protein
VHLQCFRKFFRRSVVHRTSCTLPVQRSCDSPHESVKKSPECDEQDICRGCDDNEEVPIGCFVFEND